MTGTLPDFVTDGTRIEKRRRNGTCSATGLPKRVSQRLSRIVDESIRVSSVSHPWLKSLLVFCTLKVIYRPLHRLFAPFAHLPAEFSMSAHRNRSALSVSEASPPLPMTPAEVAARGWEGVDVVLVTGDAYVDHPSFAMAILGRVLEAAGYRVAILSQPDWRSCHAWQTFGRPRLCFAISAGNIDSMLNHYTAARKVRNDDAYSPGGQIGRRPDRATAVYCQRAREAYKGVPVIAGGVEASLRRLAHYDYWSDKLRRAIILDAKADLVVYGMGEATLVEIVRRLHAGSSVAELRALRGVVYRLGASEKPPGGDAVMLPSYEEVCADKAAFARMTRLVHLETNPHNARPLVQYHGREAVVANPPALPLSQQEMDRIYGLPFTRRPHPSYGRQRIPAFAVVKDSIQIMRGCFGGCTFCSLTAHQGTHYPKPQPGVGVGRNWSHGGRSRVQRHRQRYRRPNGQHVPDELLPARDWREMPSPELLAPERVQAAPDRSRAAGALDASRAAAARRAAGAGGVGRADGPLLRRARNISAS